MCYVTFKRYIFKLSRGWGLNKEKSIKDGTTYRGESGLNSGFDLYTEEEEGVKDIHS